MDYASGNYYGKYLIRAYYFNKMPEYLGEFAKNYDLSPNSIKNKLYREENPNTYLAGFAKFLIDNKSNEYFKEIIFKGLEDLLIIKYFNMMILVRLIFTMLAQLHIILKDRNN